MWPVAALSAAVATVLLVWVLSTWTDSTIPFWDALTTSTSLVAQLMLGRKWVGNWWVWIVTDVMLVGLYASQGLWLTAVLYTGFIGLCVLGLRDWSAELRTADADARGHADAQQDAHVPVERGEVQ
ncbi:nicotinamide mononucleotide transporter family protein [Oerskovia sp. M15]